MDVSAVRFADPWALALLALVVAGSAAMAARGRRPAAGILFSSLGLLPATGSSWRVRLRWTVVPLRVLALTLLVIALARPQVVHANAETVTEGIDIVLVIDTSGSMSERGFGGGTKIDGVKRVVHDFLGGLKNDRVGIVAFSGEGLVLGPPTLDYPASQKLVAPLEVGVLSGGTAIGTGLATGLNVLRGSEAKSKIVVLLTDGENNSGDISPLDAAKMAQLLGIRVYTIGAISASVGEPQGEGVDEQLLRRMSDLSGGHYYRVTDPNSLADVYKEIEQLEKSHVGTREFTTYEEAALPFLLAGAVLLFLEIALVSTLFRRTP